MEFEKPVFYLVSKVGCVPCRSMKMIVSALPVGKNVEFVYTDAKDNPDFIAEHGIVSVPTLVRQKDNVKFIGLPKSSDYNDLVCFLKGE